jgi:hypothetical protein
MPTLINNGHITCPYCSHIVDVKQQRKGATYTQSWNKVPPRCLSIINWWMNSHASKTLSKQQLLHSYSRYHPTASTGGFFGRVSELLGLGLITQSKEIFEGEHRTRSIPMYRLNEKKARSVITHEGRLR